MTDTRPILGGIDLGGTKIQAAIVGPDRAVLGTSRRPTPTKGGPDAIVAAIAETLREAASAAKVGAEELAGVGLGTPGAVDARAGTVTGAKNLAGFGTTVPLASLVSKAIGTRVALGNDVGV